MGITYQFRRSSVGKCARQLHHSLFRLRHSANRPVDYKLPSGIQIQLYPEGEIAAFLALQGSFELTELALAASYLQPGMKAVDIGANIGLYSILSQMRVGDTGKVWAFEPSRESFRRLQRNLALNGCDLVEPVRLALADKAHGVLELTRDKGFGDAYRYLKYRASGETRVDPVSEIVPVTSLDRWASDNGICELDFLKVDIEGGEYRMFSGARNILRSSRNVVVLFESNPHWLRRSGFKQQQVFDLLRGFGLGLYAWNDKLKHWVIDTAFLLKTEMIWACFDPQRLPCV